MTEPTQRKCIFSLTGGRTGTKFLSHLIGENTDSISIHESLRAVDFGTRTPDIRTMRLFNETGFNPEIKSFWRLKFSLIPKTRNFCETNHTLAKCGLIEHIMSSEKLQNETVIISLSRSDKVRHAISHLKRGDFQNKTIDWQWYLSAQYKNLIVDPKPFLKYGRPGYIYWYIEEVSARQEYYKKIYGQYIKFVDASLEQISKAEGARALLSELGIGELKTIPPAVNQSPQGSFVDVEDQMTEIFKKTRGLADNALSQYLNENKRLHIDKANNTHLP